MDVLSELISLMERQKNGENIIEQIRHISEYNKTDNEMLNTVMSEWESMYSYIPGRIDGLDNIIKLLGLIKQRRFMSMLTLYKSQYWKELIDLRGPVETVLICECKVCKEVYHSIGMSGFLDAYGLICNTCGDVLFKSYYSETQIPACKCGGSYILGCKKCRNNTFNTIGELSPYKYFEEHKYIRDELV